MWFGVAPVSAPAGGWTHRRRDTALAYTWTKYDMATRDGGRHPRTGRGASRSRRSSPPTAATAPGLYAITFGCDGAPFSMDAHAHRVAAAR